MGRYTVFTATLRKKKEVLEAARKAATDREIIHKLAQELQHINGDLFELTQKVAQG